MFAILGSHVNVTQPIATYPDQYQPTRRGHEARQRTIALEHWAGFERHVRDHTVALEDSYSDQ